MPVRIQHDGFGIKHDALSGSTYLLLRRLHRDLKEARHIFTLCLQADDLDLSHYRQEGAECPVPRFVRYIYRG